MRLFLACLAFALLLSCTPAENESPLRIAINPWPGYEFVYLAEEKGFFDAEGVAVDVLQVSSLSDARRMFERGQSDGVGCTVIEMLQARELSPRLPQVVFVPDYSNGGDLLMAKAEIKSVAELRNKRVAFEPGTLNLYILSRALEKNGMSINDVQLVTMPQADMADALRHNEVDAVVTYPPVSIGISNEQLALPIFSSRETPGEVIDIVMFDTEVIKNRKADIKKFVLALGRAYQYAKDHPDESYALMAKREGISADEFKNAVENDLHLVDLQEQRDYFGEQGKLIEVIGLVQKVLQKNGEIKGEYQADTFIAPLWTDSSL